MSLTFDATTELDTSRLGAALAEALPPGTTVALCGTLGAGKTRLVQAIARAAGVPEGTAVSPTFVLAQEYHGRRTLYHIDAYRLRDEDEFWELGPDEFFESDGLTLVEWADRVPDCLPARHIAITIAVTGDESRRFEIIGHGEGWDATLERLRSLLEESGEN